MSHSLNLDLKEYEKYIPKSNISYGDTDGDRLDKNIIDEYFETNDRYVNDNNYQRIDTDKLIQHNFKFYGGYKHHEFISQVLIRMFDNYDFSDVNISVKIKKWFGELKRVGVKSVDGLAYFVPVKENYRSIRYIKDMFILKSTSDFGEPDSLYHEFAIGRLMNNMRKLKVPNFMYTYSYFTSSVIREINNDIFYSTVIDSEKGYMHIVLENIDNSTPFFKIDLNNKPLVIHLVLQIALALQSAYKYCKFVHNDLHMGNILIAKRETSIYKYLEYKLNDRIIRLKNIGEIACIIDFGRSQFSINDTYSIPDMNDMDEVGIVPEKNYPISDIFRMLSSIDHPVTNELLKFFSPNFREIIKISPFCLYGVKGVNENTIEKFINYIENKYPDIIDEIYYTGDKIDIPNTFVPEEFILKDKYPLTIQEHIESKKPLDDKISISEAIDIFKTSCNEKLGRLKNHFVDDFSNLKSNLNVFYIYNSILEEFFFYYDYIQDEEFSDVRNICLEILKQTIYFYNTFKEKYKEIRLDYTINEGFLSLSKMFINILSQKKDILKLIHKKFSLFKREKDLYTVLDEIKLKLTFTKIRF